MKSVTAVIFLICLTVGSIVAEETSSAQIDRDVWSVVSRTVVEADIEGMAATYHPDAVLVSNNGTVPIAQQLAEWGQDMVEAEKVGTTAKVSFRFTSRQDGKETAFETGLFKYTSTTAGGEETSYRVRFEALLVKKNGKWLMLMERQLGSADEAAWEALEASTVQAEPDEYHILVTNDDGIEAPGIQVLAEELRAVGTVHVVAPCGQRSGASMSVAVRDELHLRPVRRGDRPLGHCVDTTPAGAVILGVTTLSPVGGFDLVVSGINSNPNVGAVSLMSGTVGAAMAGAFFGIPSVAASRGGGGDYGYPARFVTEFVKELKEHPPMPGIVLSINVPKATAAETKGVSVARMGEPYILFAYDELPDEEEGRRFRPRLSMESDLTEGTDTAAFMRGMITVTPLQFDWTAYPAIDRLKGWELSHEFPRHAESE